MACKVKVNRHGYLAFRLYWDGNESWEGTEWKDTTKNRIKAEARAVLMSEQMENGSFDYLKWFPEGNKAHLFRTEKVKVERKTIRQYFGEWMRDKVATLVKKSRARKYRSHFHAHILEDYGETYLDSFTVAQLRALRAELIECKGLSVKTVKNTLNATLRAFFRDAKAEGLIERSPFDDLPRNWWPRTVLPQPDPFSENERDKIIEYVFAKYWAKWPSGCVFLYALFWTGARPSELTARRWRDIDLQTGTLSIYNSRTEYEEGETKTAASIRTITLNRNLIDYLKQIKPLRAQPEDYIFTQRNGSPINQLAFGQRYFQGALTALNVRHRDFYHTRHTFISVQLSYGENVKQIAEYVGTSAAMIFSRYGRWVRGHTSFGKAAMEAANPKPFPKPFQASNWEFVQKQVVGLVRGGGLEPPRHFCH
jgi:integrase